MTDRTNFYRPNSYVRIFKAKVDDRERAIRLYCEQAGASWMLQVRGPMSLGSSGYGPDGKDFIIAGAALGVESMRALRDAIDRLLKEDGLLEETTPANALAAQIVLDEGEWLTVFASSDPHYVICPTCGASYANTAEDDPTLRHLEACSRKQFFDEVRK